MRCRQRVDGKQSQRGLAIDQNDVVIIDDRTQNARERRFSSNLIDELHFSSGQIDVRRDNIQARNRSMAQSLMNIFLRIHQEVVDGVLHIQCVNTQSN